jgi:hypothetical protein
MRNDVIPERKCAAIYLMSFVATRFLATDTPEEKKRACNFRFCQATDGRICRMRTDCFLSESKVKTHFTGNFFSNQVTTREIMVFFLTSTVNRVITFDLSNLINSLLSSSVNFHRNFLQKSKHRSFHHRLKK